MRNLRRKYMPFLLSLAVGIYAGTESIAAQQGTLEVKGTVTLRVSAISALYPNGSPDPTGDKACREKFGHLIGKAATTAFNVNTTTYFMSATTAFESQTFQQSPLGISGSYDFGAFFHPPLPPLNVYAALFNISLQFTDPATQFVLMLNESTNCLASTNSVATKK